MINYNEDERDTTQTLSWDRPIQQTLLKTIHHTKKNYHDDGVGYDDMMFEFDDEDFNDSTSSPGTESENDDGEQNAQLLDVNLFAYS